MARSSHCLHYHIRSRKGSANNATLPAIARPRRPHRSDFCRQLVAARQSWLASHSRLSIMAFLKTRHLHLRRGFAPRPNPPGGLRRRLWPRRRPQCRQVWFRFVVLVVHHRIPPHLWLMNWIPRLGRQCTATSALCSLPAASDSPESPPTLISTAHEDSPPDLPALPHAGLSCAPPGQAEYYASGGSPLFCREGLAFFGELDFRSSVKRFSHAAWAREQRNKPVCDATIRAILLGRPSVFPSDFLEDVSSVR